MTDTSGLSEAKRALLEKYLRGDRPPSTTPKGAIAQTAKAVVEGQRESAIAIQAGEAKRPFFFLHGDWINRAYWCFPLARALGADQPFYALEPYNFDGLSVPPSLETIAIAHLKSIRSIQPEGPYLLGGFCNGGLLAYEIARQLHVEGQKLDLLVLMDPVPMGSFYPAHHRLARAVISRLGKMIRLSQEKQMYGYILMQHISNYLRSSHYRRSKDWPWRGSEQLERERDKGGFARGLDSIFPPVEALRQHYSAIYDWTALRYEPPSPYPGKVTFFWPSKEPRNRKGWRKVADSNEISIYIIPGTQMESRTQYLHVLAEHLQACLSRVQATALN